MTEDIIDPPYAQSLTDVLSALAEDAHAIAKSKGFWPKRELSIDEFTDAIAAEWQGEDLSTPEDVRDFARRVGEYARATASVPLAQPLALVHSELSEVLEALRSGNPPSEKIGGFSQAEEEMADVIIRCVDLASHEEWDLAGAILAKRRYNLTRPHKHGRKF